MQNKAVIRKISSISPVWIVPIVALTIAVWLAVDARMKKGTKIEITFSQATEIVAGQTLIKLKDVEVGMVKSVRLSKDLSSVIVRAELDRSVSSHLSENSRFWVVTPRISATGVSNLGTLISGVYIVMDPGEKGEYTTRFKGLSDPPAFESDERGTPFVLQSHELGSLDIGSPVYFRQIRVGEVTGYQLSQSRDYVDVNIFIEAPHDTLVHTRSRFWNVSGFGVSVNADGMKAKMASLASLINGGIAFDNAAGYEASEIAPEGHRFNLYPDRESVLEGQFDLEYYYLLKFSGTLRGLTVGAPVEFRGIKIGEVVDVELSSAENASKTLHVYISMEPQRLDPSTSPSREEVDAMIANMVNEGLRAQMKTASMITGSRFIDLAFFDDAPQGELIVSENYSEIPTMDDNFELVTKQLSNILAKVEQVPIDKIGNDLASSMASLNKMLATMEKRNTAEKMDGAVGNLEQTLASANQALEQIALTMKSLDNTLAPDSEFKYELTETLKSLGDAAASVEIFMNELNRHPNSLITGGKKDE